VIALSDIRERLGQRGCRVTGGPTQWSAQCPAHEDDRPSLRLASGQDGRPLLHCMAGCAPDDVLGALELTWSDVLPPRAEQSRERPQHVATYVYRDLEGKPLYEVRRFAPKTFRPTYPVRHALGCRLTPRESCTGSQRSRRQSAEVSRSTSVRARRTPRRSVQC